MGGHAFSWDLCSDGGITGTAQAAWGRFGENSLPTCPSGSHLFLYTLREQHQDAGLDGQGNVPAQLLQVSSQRHPIHPGEGGGRHRGGGVCRDETDQRPRVLPPKGSQGHPPDIPKVLQLWPMVPPPTRPSMPHILKSSNTFLESAHLHCFHPSPGHHHFPSAS